MSDVADPLKRLTYIIETGRLDGVKDAELEDPAKHIR